jgi:signal transduction histidine kinase
MMCARARHLYDDTMLGAAKRYLHAAVRRNSPGLAHGFNWTFVATIDVTMAAVGAVAIVQRPSSDLFVAVAALVIAFSPWLLFVSFDIGRFEALALWAAWMAGTAILLFATSTPIYADFAPLQLGLMVGVVCSLTSMRGGFLAAVSAAALLGAAAVMHRVETPALYLSFIGIGWLVGYLMHVQQQLLLDQRAAQEQLSKHAADDERRRIAREVHDVIAHSLSITLLHVTGARRALQQDRDVDDAVDALEQAELLGRQAMADIRRTVGLLDGPGGKLAPEPGMADIDSLVEDFARAGVDVVLRTDGDLESVSPAAGLALYRIAQESLSNIAKHAAESSSTMTVSVSRTAAALTVVNRLPAPAADRATDAPAEGRGLRGMRQRVELLSGTMMAGPTGDGWSVRADIPLDVADTNRPPWACGT